MKEKDFENVREGMDFHIAYDGESYDISVMINKRTCDYEIVLNQNSLKSGSLCWTWNCFAETLVVDDHQFLVVVQRAGIFSLRYQMECFADGISVSDGKTTLESFRRELVKFSLRRSMKTALRDPFGFLLGFIGFFLLVFLFKWAETGNVWEAFIKGNADLAFLVFLYFLFSFMWDFANYICHRKTLLKLLGACEDKERKL